MLQWGRDLTVADIRSSRGGLVGLGALQWGRDLTVADMWPRALSPGEVARFNGAAT